MEKIQFMITKPDNVHHTYGFQFFIPWSKLNTSHERSFEEIDECIRKFSSLDSYTDFKSLGVFFQGKDKNWRYYEFLGTTINDLTKQEIILKYAQWFLDEFETIKLVEDFDIF